MKKLLMGMGLMVLCAGCLSLGPQEDTRPLGPEGQRLNRIEGTIPIALPTELTNAQVLDCVEQSIESTGDNKRKSYWVSQWRLEQRDAKDAWIVIGLTVRSHYLQVCYRIENGQLIPDVPYSVDLDQDKTKIHRKVPEWINNLRPLIQAKLYHAVKEARSKATVE